MILQSPEQAQASGTFIKLDQSSDRLEVRINVVITGDNFFWGSIVKYLENLSPRWIKIKKTNHNKTFILNKAFRHMSSFLHFWKISKWNIVF